MDLTIALLVCFLATSGVWCFIARKIAAHAYSVGLEEGVEVERLAVRRRMHDAGRRHVPFTDETALKVRKNQLRVGRPPRKK